MQKNMNYPSKRRIKDEIRNVKSKKTTSDKIQQTNKQQQNPKPRTRETKFKSMTKPEDFMRIKFKWP